MGPVALVYPLTYIIPSLYLLLSAGLSRHFFRRIFCLERAEALADDMASMLQQFIYRGTKYSKQKAKNQDLNFTVQQDDRPLSPESFMSPEIVNINEVSFVPVGRSQTSSLYEEESYGSYDSRLEEPRSNQMSPQLEVDIPTEPLTDWFTHDTLRMAGAFAESFQMSNGSGSISGSVYGVEVGTIPAVAVLL